MLITSEESELTLELKYCEWCGALWFRLPGNDSCYCEACTQWITSQMPPPFGEA